MAADTVGAAALQLLARLAAQGVDEAAAFLQAHPAAAAGDAVGPVPPALAWRGGRRAMLLEDNSLSSGATAVYIIVSVLLVVFAGMMAGLTLGLLSLDKVDLEVIKRSGTEKQRWLVTQVEPVLARPHYLLATLLLCNAAAMEALPIFLDRLLNPLAAILISVTAILVFGEILPQAVCKKYGLQVGAYLAVPVRILMLVTGPVTWPISKLLDWILGEETVLFRRQELKALVDIHAEQQEGEEVAALTADEVQVIQGALDMATKTAESAMTPMDKVFMLAADDVINMELLHKVINAGHSRVPVYSGSRQNILGLVLVKELVLVDETKGLTVNQLRLHELPFIRADIPMYDALKIFKMGRSHMAVLTKVTSRLDDASSPVEKQAAVGLARPSPGITAAHKGGGDLNGVANGGAGGSGHGHRRTSSAGSQGLPSLARLFVKPSPRPEQPEQPPPEIIGIITIEDVLEELLQAEILDETDQFMDNAQSVPAVRLLSVQHLPPHLRRFLTRSAIERAGGTPLSSRRAPSTTESVPPSGVAPPAPSTVAANAEARPASAAAVLQPAGTAPAAGGPGLPRAASAASMSAAAAAGAIMAASAVGAGNMPAMGAAVGASMMAAGQISAASGGHPVPSMPRPPLPSMRRQQSVGGGMGAAGGGTAAMPVRRPPFAIPRRGGSSTSSLSAAREAELAAAADGPPQQAGAPSSQAAEGTELATLGSPGTSPPV